MPLRTKAYLDLALLGKNRWWRYVLGVLLIIVTSLALMLGIASVTSFLKKLGLLSAPIADRVTGIAMGTLADQSVLAFALLNCSIYGMALGLFLAMWLLHRRPIKSLITPYARFDWKRMLAAMVVGFVILSVITLAEHLIYPGRYRWTFDSARFFPFLFAAAILTPLQCASEELIFRGWTMQGLGVLTRNLPVIALVSSLLFGAVHLFNPEVARYGFWLMAAAYVLSGLLFASVALRDGRLELAIGLHSINNLFSGLVANSDGSVLQTNSLFTSVLDPVYSIIGLVVTIIAFHWWFFDRPAAKARLAAEDAASPQPVTA